VTPGPSWWHLGVSIYLPSMLFATGQGAIAPVVALSALELGASPASAAAAVATVGLGKVVGALPAGVLANRVGERTAMVMAAALAVAALSVCLVAHALWMLCTGLAFTGLASAVWGLARHAYLTEAAPYGKRGRALSMLGGLQRIGMFVGPLMAVAAMSAFGTAAAYAVHIATTIVAACVLLVVPDPPGAAAPVGGFARESTLRIIGRHLPVLRTLGVGAMMISAVRASRQVIIPLWADHIHLDPATTSLIYSASAAVEVLLFYPAGLLMDRMGRRWALVPCLACLSAGHIALPFTHSLATLAAVALVMGLGNGMGSGINMTIGADVSPATSRSVFLGAWRLLSDVGDGAGPLLVGAVSAAAALATASLGVAALAAGCAAAMAVWIPRHIPPRGPK
jgi:MFS family permease